MDVQLLQILGRTAGLAGLSIGLILFLYRQIVGKNVFPILTKRDAYRLFRIIVILSWSVAVLGILCWVLPKVIPHRNEYFPDKPAGIAEEPNVIAGTIVDQATNLGIGQATLMIEGQGTTYTSEDNGNFRVSLSQARRDPVRLTATKGGYITIDESVTPPTHALILQMRHQP